MTLQAHNRHVHDFDISDPRGKQQSSMHIQISHIWLAFLPAELLKRSASMSALMTATLSVHSNEGPSHRKILSVRNLLEIIPPHLFAHTQKLKCWAIGYKLAEL